MAITPALHLRTTRGPDGVPPQSRDVRHGEVVLGRAPACDWVLPDPGRVLSKRHCSVSDASGIWSLTDLSSNGTWLNGEPMENGMPRSLRNGDRVTLGVYEIEVQLEARGVPPNASEPLEKARDEDRLTGDPFAPALLPGIGLPINFDPLMLGEADGGFSDGSLYPAANHTPALGGHFRAPRSSAALVPEGWDRGKVREPGSDLIPEGWDLDEPEPAQSPMSPAPPAGRASPEPGVPEPPIPAPGTATDLSCDSACDAFAAFAAGAGITGQPRLDPKLALGELGRAFRSVVAGLRAVMIARAGIKNEFRIEQTMVRASGNNPLKFAADDDDALAALLGVGRHGGMSASRAVTEGLRDMRLHELAVAAATQSAIRDLLDEVSPARLSEILPSSAADVLPGRRAQRCWQAWQTRHERLLRAQSDDFDSLFGRSFARAYEAALADLTAASDEDGEAPPAAYHRAYPHQIKDRI